jgi:tetratricopeptide (TPR) repeat protein
MKSNKHLWIATGVAVAAVTFGLVAVSVDAGPSDWTPPGKSAKAKADAKAKAAKAKRQTPRAKRADPAELFKQGSLLAEQEKYSAALPLFERANRIDSNNPDTLNMLAFTQRKLGDLDDALVNYGKALKLRSRFPEAREYRGEAYVQAALREIKILRSYGPSAEHELKDLIETFKDAAKTLDASPAASQPATSQKSTKRKWKR